LKYIIEHLGLISGVALAVE
jgi:hypothetical protein